MLFVKEKKGEEKMSSFLDTLFVIYFDIQGCQIWPPVEPDLQQIGQICDFLWSVFCSVLLSALKGTDTDIKVTDLSHLVSIWFNWEPNLTSLSYVIVMKEATLTLKYVIETQKTRRSR